MRRGDRTFGAIVVGACLAGVLAACGGDDGGDGLAIDGDPTPTASEETSPAEPTPEAEEGRIGGAETGFTVEIPDGWVEINPKAEDLVREVEEAGLTENPELVQQLIGQLADLPGVFFAFDVKSAVETGGQFATNVNGYCVSAGPISSLGDVAQATEVGLGQVGGEDIETSETTIGELDAVRTTYTLRQEDQSLAGLQYAFFGADDDKVCYVTFTTTTDDRDVERFEEVAATIQLA